ncbi:MAG: ChaN family lipoprotein [Myxococcaceae bacterium]
MGPLLEFMRTALSLQRSLFRHQARQIARAVQSGSRAFLAYQRRYQRATRTFRRTLQMSEVHRRIARADVVYVGDYHTLRLAQHAYLELVEHALQTGRRVVLALEFVESRHQATLDAFLAGKLGEKAFLTRIGHPYHGPFDIWPGFAPIFTLARRKKLEVVAIDRRAPGPRSLEMRDVGAAEQIARVVSSADDSPLVLVLMGQFHVTPGHLPREVDRRLERPIDSLVVYQNAEGLYWALARRGLVETTRAVEISDRELCLINTSPVVSQRSFLDYVEAETGDAPLEDAGIAQTFRHLARELGRQVGCDVRSQVKAVEVFTPSTFDFLTRLRRRGNFDRAELRELERHVLSLESGWIPRANAVWLASMSLNHASEEAAHFVRSAAVGKPLDRPRPAGEAFWARCLEEAVGFLGSRLINPKRRCLSLDEWAFHFEGRDRERREIAAFTLAIATALRQGSNASALVPSTSKARLATFHGVTHAVGYLLGDALARALTRRRLSRAELADLFTDPFDDPAPTFARLAARFEAFGRGEQGHHAPH